MKKKASTAKTQSLNRQDPRRRRILLAAQAEFANSGFQHTEVKTIAEAASVGKATIYKFFSSKEDLLVTIVEENLFQMRDLALTAIMKSGSPIKRLEAAIGAMAAYVGQNRPFCNVLIQEAGDFKGDIQRHHFALVEQNLPLADAFFSTLREQGHFTALDTRQTLQLLIDTFIGAVYSWAITESEEELETKVLAYLKVIVRGLQQ